MSGNRKVINRILGVVLAKSESARDYDGLFSWVGEGRAFLAAFSLSLVGGYIGAAAVVGALINEEVALEGEIVEKLRLEPFYALAGMLIGLGLHYAFKIPDYYPDLGGLV